MESLKGLPFTIVLCLCGVALLLLALGGSFNASGLSIALNDHFIRVASGFSAITIITVAVVLEFKTRNSTITGSDEPKLKNDMGAIASDTAFFTLDDRGAPRLSRTLKDARRISMMMRSGVSLFSQYEALFTELVKSGCEMRVVLCDPASPVARTIYGGSDNSFQGYLSATRSSLARIANAGGSGKLHVRLVSYAPTFSMMLVEHVNSAHDRVQVSLVFTHTKYGRDRPTFILKHADRWYTTFVGEYEAAWAVGKESTLVADGDALGTGSAA